MINRRLNQLSVVAVVLILLTAGSLSAATHNQNELRSAQEWSSGVPDITLMTNGWVDVREVLRTFIAHAELGLELAPDVSGKVNVHLRKVPVSQALESILDPIELGYEVVDGTLVVYKHGMVTRWFTFDYPVTQRLGSGELQASMRLSGGSGGESGGSSGGGGNQSQVVSSSSMSVWPDIVAALSTLVFPEHDLTTEDQATSISLADAAGRSLIVNSMGSLIQVTAEWQRVSRVQSLLKRLKESLQRQVAIEVQILEVVLDKNHQTGINWNTISGGDWDASFTSDNSDQGSDFFQFLVDASEVTGMVEAVSTTGEVKVVSSPRITTLNNQKAVVRIVTEEVYYLAEVEPVIVTEAGASQPVVTYTPAIVPVGVVLDVTPQVGRDRVVTLNVHPTISNILRIVESPNQDTSPVVSVRELDTVGKVPDGQTLVIAGFMYEASAVRESGIPLLKSIPLLGYFFKKSSREKHTIEMIMLLTPVILNNENAAEMAEETRALLESQM